MLVKADSAQVVRLTELASFVLSIAINCNTLLVAPIGVQKGCRQKDKYINERTHKYM